MSVTATAADMMSGLACASHDATRVVAAVAAESWSGSKQINCVVDEVDARPKLSYVDRIEEAVGLIAKRSLAEGAALITRDARHGRQPCKEGDTVRLRAVSGAAQITLDVQCAGEPATSAILSRKKSVQRPRPSSTRREGRRGDPRTMKRILYCLLYRVVQPLAKKPHAPEPTPLEAYIQASANRSKSLDRQARVGIVYGQRGSRLGDLASDLRARRWMTYYHRCRRAGIRGIAWLCFVFTKVKR